VRVQIPLLAPSFFIFRPRRVAFKILPATKNNRNFVNLSSKLSISGPTIFGSAGIRRTKPFQIDDLAFEVEVAYGLLSVSEFWEL
jgi:hypothetical protein